MTKRVATAAFAVAAFLVVDAAPVSAHTVTGVAPTNYRSEVFGFSPFHPDGVRLQLFDLGRRVRLVNDGPHDVTIIGYSGEAYLRVGRRGVFENVHSPAVYFNKVTRARSSTTTTLPPVADANAEPKWRETSHGHSVTWRDRRTRWEGSAPPGMAQNAGAVQVASWAIPLSWRQRTTAVMGRIVWEPAPAVRRWLVVALVAFFATALLGAAERWGRLLHGALAFLVAINAVHSFVAAIPVHDALVVLVLKVLGVGFLATAAWIVAILSFGSLDCNGEGGLLGAVVAGLLLAVYGGGTDIPMLTHSQVLYAAPVALARTAVCLTLGIGSGLVAAGLLVYLLRPEMRPTVAAAHERDTPREGERR